jgi:flagellar biosynthetic protein FliR
MDPTSGQQIPLIGSFLYNLSVIVFLATNGHHVLITALVNSFQRVPLQMLAADVSLAEIITRFTVGIFTTGMQIALPVSFAILLTNVGLGILARTMPQLNIFVVGVPLQIVIGLFMLSIVVPFYVLFLDVLFNEVYGNISLVLRAI